MSPTSAAIPEIRRRLLDEVYAVVLPGRAVGPGDDFFEAGGDSMGLIRLVALAQEAFGVEISAREFFLAPTLDALAEAVARADLVATVQNLSDDEVRRLLDRTAP